MKAGGREDALVLSYQASLWVSIVELVVDMLSIETQLPHTAKGDGRIEGPVRSPELKSSTG